MKKIIVPAAIALAAILCSLPAVAAQPTNCRSACGPELRDCLQQGRPALRTCLGACRSGEGACPKGVDLEDCADADPLRGCVTACRDARRNEIRACVQRGVECNARCRLPDATPTATPLTQ